MARPADGGRRLAFRRFLGRNVLSHQVDCALEMGCEAILCMVDGIGQDVIESQHRAEAAKVRFQTIADTRALAALVKADDEMFVLGDGVLPDPDLVNDQLGQGRGILAFPADQAIARGFERIDAAQAWAGAMLIRGAAAERLMELPSDAEAASALVRIGLASGVRMVALDPEVLDRGEWMLAAQDDRLAERERDWIRRHVDPSGFSAPGNAIAERIGLRLARDIVGHRSELAPTWVAVVSGALAALASLMGHPLIALGVALPMAVALPVASAVDRVSRIGERFRGRLPVQATLRWAADFLLVGLIAQAARPDGGAAWVAFVMSLSLVGSLKIAERHARPGIRELFGDRILLLALLIPSAVLGVLLPIVALLTLVALAAVVLTDITTD